MYETQQRVHPIKIRKQSSTFSFRLATLINIHEHQPQHYYVSPMDNINVNLVASVTNGTMICLALGDITKNIT